jgi:type VII secretion-associated protein (TIGR03931 family)
VSDARVAVDLGRRAVRVATASGVSTVAAAGDPVASVRAALGSVRPLRLVLTHPARWSPARAERLRRAVSDAADRVEVLTAPQAAAGRPAGSVAVLDVGARDAEATVIAVSASSCARSGRPSETAIVVCRHEAVGGDDLDEALLDTVGRPWRGLLDSIDPTRAPQRRSLRVAARCAREQLTTSDSVVLRFAEAEVAVTQAQLREASAAVLGRAVDLLATAIGVDQPWPPVLLIGGVAQTPQLAELVAQRGATAVTVATEPGTAAVRGALALATPPPASRPLLPPVPPPRRHLLRNGLTAALAAAVLVVAGHLLTPAPPAPSTAAGPVDGLLVQYDYSLQLPAGWQHTGGLPEHRRSLLTPSDRPGGSDLISVEETVLDYDASAEPRRAAAELRARYDTAVASGAALEGFNPAASLAGRQVTTYRQRQPERDAVVDWYVMFDRGAQLSVGCQHTAAGAVAVGAGCEAVVGSLRLHPR